MFTSTLHSCKSICTSQKTHSLIIWSQLALIKSHARGWPMGLLAMVIMVAVASCLRIFSGSRQYCRYLKHSFSEDKRLLRKTLFHNPNPAATELTMLQCAQWPELSVTATDLFSSQGCLVQDRACMSFSASEAMVAFLYMDQAKSHSSTPPAAIALQYTVLFKLALILEWLIKMLRSYERKRRNQGGQVER